MVRLPTSPMDISGRFQDIILNLVEGRLLVSGYFKAIFSAAMGCASSSLRAQSLSSSVSSSFQPRAVRNESKEFQNLPKWLMLHMSGFIHLFIYLFIYLYSYLYLFIFICLLAKDGQSGWSPIGGESSQVHSLLFSVALSLSVTQSFLVIC